MIKVLLAEDMHMVRGALVALLNLESDIQVVAEVSSGDQILPAAKASRPDVAVIDIDLPGKDGLSAAIEIHESLPGCHTLILTSLGRPGTVRRALDAKVNGFLLKDAPSDKLANAVRSVAIGRRVIDSELALAAWETDDCPLTPREVEILDCVARGNSNKEIARLLSISDQTVKNHITSILRKLAVNDRTQAVIYALRHGWIKLGDDV